VFPQRAWGRVLSIPLMTKAGVTSSKSSRAYVNASLKTPSTAELTETQWLASHSSYPVSSYTVVAPQAELRAEPLTETPHYVLTALQAFIIQDRLLCGWLKVRCYAWRSLISAICISRVNWTIHQKETSSAWGGTRSGEKSRPNPMFS
jgi:hypothetical protein